MANSSSSSGDSDSKSIDDLSPTEAGCKECGWKPDQKVRTYIKQVLKVLAILPKCENQGELQLFKFGLESQMSPF